MPFLLSDGPHFLSSPSIYIQFPSILYPFPFYYIPFPFHPNSFLLPMYSFDFYTHSHVGWSAFLALIWQDPLFCYIQFPLLFVTPLIAVGWSAFLAPRSILVSVTIPILILSHSQSIQCPYHYLLQTPLICCSHSLVGRSAFGPPRFHGSIYHHIPIPIPSHPIFISLDLHLIACSVLLQLLPPFSSRMVRFLCPFYY
jgi:hypothetical protein